MSATESTGALQTNCAAGLPERLSSCVHDPKDLELVVRNGYALLHSGEHKIPLWVSEQVSRTRLAGSRLLSFVGRLFEGFSADPSLAGPRANPEDYADDRFDPGHLAAAGNITNKGDAFKAMRAETFYLSNNAPMRKQFNRGVWLRLEQLVREWALRYESVWSISGPAFEVRYAVNLCFR